MKPNIGTMDRALRILIGLSLAVWGIATKNWLGALGAIPLLTAFIRFCPLYRIIGLSTCGKGDGGGCCGGGKCNNQP